MKKTLRIMAAFILAAVMAFGTASSAFAADESTLKMEWTNLFGDDYSFYFSDVVLKEGENTITYADINADIMSIDEEELRGINCVCYEFEAEESGYYLMSTLSDTVYAVAENYNGKKASGCCDFISYGEEPYNRIFYIEKGTALVGVTFAIESYILMDSAKIEYLGSEIENYTLNEERLDDFIIGLNVWEDNSGEIAMASDCEITFTPENKLSVNDIVLMGTCRTTPKEGKNKAAVELFGIKKEVEFTAYYIDTLVKSAEISNLDDHTVFSYDYKGERHYEDASGETITVKFNDGTEYSAVLNESAAEIILPTGLIVNAYAGLTLNNDGSYDFIVSVGNEIIEKYDVTEENNTFFENIGTLTDDNFEALYKSFDDFIVGVQYIGSDIEFMKVCFGLVAEDWAQLFTNLISFINYCIG